MLSAWIAECNLPTIGKICVLGNLSIFRATHKISPVKHCAAGIWNRSNIHLAINTLEVKAPGVVAERVRVLHRSAANGRLWFGPMIVKGDGAGPWNGQIRHRLCLKQTPARHCQPAGPTISAFPASTVGGEVGRRNPSNPKGAVRSAATLRL